MKRMGLALTAALALTLLGGCGKSGNQSSSSQSGTKPAGASTPRLRIAVIPKGNTDVYWKYVHAGADAAGRKLGVKILFQGPAQDGDRAAEIALMQNFITQGVSGIVLAPVDSRALVPPVKLADAAHIPVVIIDSALRAKPGKDYVSFVATNNYKAGEIAGNYLAKLLGGKGKVAMLRFIVGSASTDDRAAGCLAALKKFPGIQIIANQRGGSTASKCKSIALSMANSLQQADGIFAANETTAFGMYLALKQLSLLGKKKFVGFDWQSNFKQPIEKGQINGVVVQDPFRMAYMGVTYLVDDIRGQKPPVELDTPAALVTTKNINTPKIEKLITLPPIH
jgi:ribose transport system substrate-binding protein